MRIGNIRFAALDMMSGLSVIILSSHKAAVSRLCSFYRILTFPIK
jgi:hypothetical protein